MKYPNAQTGSKEWLNSSQPFNKLDRLENFGLSGVTNCRRKGSLYKRKKA